MTSTSGNLQARNEMLGFPQIERIVVDEEHGFRAQLNVFDQRLDPRPLRIPVDAREDEKIPDAFLGENGLGRRHVVLRTDCADDAALGERNDEVVVRRVILDAALGECAAPEGLIEIPDHEPDGLSHDLNLGKCRPF